MPGSHAVLSPSAAERWLSCPASVRVGQAAPRQPESVYAAEGTAAHALAEIRVTQALRLKPKFNARKAVQEWVHEFGIHGAQLAEMEEHIETYVQLIRERRRAYPHTQVMLEQKLDTGIPQCWGTSDAVLLSPNHIEIIDFKYGQGIPVYAAENPQLRIYGLGALHNFGDLLGETRTVRMTVCQPRLDSISSEELTAGELLEWRTRILPIAEEALGDDAHFGPSPEACRWCPIAGSCRARMEHEIGQTFGPPDELTPEEVAEAFGRIKGIKAYLEDLADYALDLAYSQGTEIPGYKVVRSNGRRQVVDTDAAIQTLIDAGYAASDVAKVKLATFEQLEAMVGGTDALHGVIGDYITKSEGKPALVKDTDKRPSINPNSEAAKVFSNDE